MKKFINLFRFSVLALIILVLSSCGKTDNPFNVIPKNATVVVVANGKTLSEKAGIENFTTTNTYALLKEEVDDENEIFKTVEPIFANTEESGINFKKDFFFFMYKKESVNYLSFYFNLLDAAKFESIVNKINETEGSDLTISKDGKYSYLWDEEGDSPMMLWNDKQLIFTISTNGELTKEEYLKETKGLLVQKTENSINENEDFAKFIDNQKDISLWMDYSVFYDYLPPMQKMMIQSNLPYDMTGTLIHTYVDFQNGKVEVNYDVVMNDEFKSFMEDNKIIKDKFDTDLLSVFPEKSFANFSIAIDFLGYFNLIKDMMEENQQNIDNFDEQFKAQTGMTIKEALNEFSGEISMGLHRIAFEDVEKIDYMAYYQAGGQGDINEFKKIVNKPVFYFNTAIAMNNDKLFNVFLQNLGNMVTKTGDYYTIDNSSINAYFGLFGKYLVYTNDKDLIEKIATGKMNSSLKDSEVASHLAKYPAYAFIDFDLDNYPQDVKDALEAEMGSKNYLGFSKVFSSYKKVEIIPKSTAEASLLFWLKDDSKNSLEVILKGFDDNIQALAD